MSEQSVHYNTRRTARYSKRDMQLRILVVYWLIVVIGRSVNLLESGRLYATTTSTCQESCISNQLILKHGVVYRDTPPLQYSELKYSELQYLELVFQILLQHTQALIYTLSRVLYWEC